MGARARWTARILAAGLLAGLSFEPAGAAVADAGERGRAIRLRTAGRAEFLPDLTPPSGPVWSDTLRLGGATELHWGVGSGMDRVDGFRPLGRIELRERRRGARLGLYAAHGTSSGRWSAAGFAGLRLGPAVRLGVRLYDETATFPDAVRSVTADENFFAALLLREDFFDFLRRRGGAAVFYWRPEPRRESQVLLAREDHESVERTRRRLGPFGGEKTFRPNPAVPEKRWGFARIRQIWTTRPRGGWAQEDAHAALAEAVIGAKRLGSEFDFLRLRLEFRGRQRLALSQFFAYKISGGSGQSDAPPPAETAPLPPTALTGAAAAPGSGARSAVPDLPEAWRFRSGGIGTLRAHDFQEFTGDREILLTFEYGLELQHQVRPILFVDSGRTWISRVRRTGGVWGSGPFQFDGGLGLQLGAGPLSGRIDVARNLRRERATARVTFRLGYPF